MNERVEQRNSIYRELACMAVFVNKWYFIREMQLTPEEELKMCRLLLQAMLGSMEKDGLLQKRQNREMNGILTRLHKDLPRIGRRKILMFSYLIAGFPNSLIKELAGFSCVNAVCVAKTQLRQHLQYLNSPYKHEYLALLNTKGCRFSKEMLYLHNL